MNEEIMDLAFWQVGAAYVFVLILVWIVRVKGIRREKEIFIGTTRMTLQLILVGYILMFLFEQANPFLTIGTVILMQTFAVYNIYQRTKLPLTTALKKVIALSMSAGIAFSIIFFMFLVLNLDPWYDPRYFIPIAGMIIGNSMTGITLGVNNLVVGMRDNQDQIEGALMLGASPKEASKMVSDQAFDAAMLPTINAMVGMGIVFLPGMMTGQIIGGASPITAVEYQIAIMLGIVGSVSLSVLLFLQYGYRSYFNEQAQLIPQKNKKE
ncbi:ABC transporter permease [Alkalicoccus urumqiensis]|uniref:Iron export ABC transporter permease subunit FetB n=1 Tax=Alkalicoccus urumqiensis TaxID=1548213 RepID=A0A2P6MIV6_ALKUR|nr:iron export ABC transporter permease subunit FetB [Alkalicoccus urumqiensis]PRO66173.1 iron export ABC transporter permease subunit FetB [Alkalicoccus urumqiensis]